MKPPKCKTCGAEEWQHVCGPVTIETADVTKPVTKLARAIVTEKPSPPQGHKGGRVRVYASATERQRAHRARKKMAACPSQ